MVVEQRAQAAVLGCSAEYADGAALGTLSSVCPQVHKMLAEFRLIPGLNNLFDKLIWRKYTASNHVVHSQNENCDCSPVCRNKPLIRLLNPMACHC